MVSTEDCWHWAREIGASGYGRAVVYINGKKKYYRAHQVMYENMIGPIPDGLELDHLCRVRCCVNPEHLEPVTHAENMARRIPFIKLICNNGHALTPDNVYIFRQKRNPLQTFKNCRMCQLQLHKKRYYEKKAKKGYAE